MQKSLFSLCCAVLASVAFATAQEAKEPSSSKGSRTGGVPPSGPADQTFKPVQNWASIPDKLQIGPTHGGVAVDKGGFIYASSDSANGIYVFSPDGRLVRTIAPEFATIHQLTIHEHKGQEFIYGAYLRGAQMVKLTLEGKPVLSIGYPKESNAYPEGKGFRPTAVAVAPSGEIFVADGYGLSLIHKFDTAGKYVKTFGGKGKEDGKFTTCHGLILDRRYDRPLLLVCDRENRRVVHHDLDGNFVAVVASDLRRPASAAIGGDYLAVAEIEGRVTILDKNNKVVAHLGDNPDKAQWAKFDVPPENWLPGVLTAPHGIAYDLQGNLYVEDWNKTGRVTKFSRVAR